jgi:hypothetical protein
MSWRTGPVLEASKHRVNCSCAGCARHEVFFGTTVRRGGLYRRLSKRFARVPERRSDKVAALPFELLARPQKFPLLSAARLGFDRRPVQLARMGYAFWLAGCLDRLLKRAVTQARPVNKSMASTASLPTSHCCCCCCYSFQGPPAAPVFASVDECGVHASIILFCSSSAALHAVREDPGGEAQAKARARARPQMKLERLWTCQNADSTAISVFVAVNDVMPP